MWKRLAIIALALALSACGTRAPATGQLEVNGHVVSLALYHSLVAAEQRRSERIGLRVDATSPAGRQREASIERSVIRELVRDAVIEQLAQARGIRVSAAQLGQRLAAAEQAFGDPSAFDRAVQEAGLEKAAFSALLRYRMLEAQLAQVNAGDAERAIDEALAHARVAVSIGPCQETRSYPACLTAP